MEQLEAEHQRLLERLYDFDSSTADYYNYAQSLIEAAKQGGSLMGNSWDASTSTFLNPAMLNMEWRPLVDSAWEKLSEEYILFRGKYVHVRRKLEQYWNRQDGYFEEFTNDVKSFINNPDNLQKSGTWWGVEGTHVYDSNTGKWVFINSDGSFNTGFKLSTEQLNYLIETGVVK